MARKLEVPNLVLVVNFFAGACGPYGSRYAISTEQFDTFVDTVIIPRPDGLTRLAGAGQFRMANGSLIKETSFVLILFYPYEDRAVRISF